MQNSRFRPPGRCVVGTIYLVVAIVSTAAPAIVRGQLVRAPHAQTSTQYADLDGDGQPEIVLENPYLRVEITTGRPSQTPEDDTAGPRRQRYSTRFVWAGWIHNITFKPTEQRWFVNDSEHHWHGIPEEFEEAVKMKGPQNGEFDVLKIGIGRCKGSGICHHSRLKLLEPASWTHTVGDTPRQGKRVTFEQNVRTTFGYGYAYTKELVLEPDTATLVVNRRLHNTGGRPIRTTWYTHGFWGQAPGDAYDTNSWSTIPLFTQVAENAALPAGIPAAGCVVDTRSCQLHNPGTPGIWGSIDAGLMAESWYASGHRTKGDVLATGLDTPLTFARIWTYRNTYSCEPFLALDLAPGEQKLWTVTRRSATGLSGIRGIGPGGLVQWQFGKARNDGKRSLTVEFASDRPVEGLTLDASIQACSAAAGAAAQRVQCPLERCAPDRAFIHTFTGNWPEGWYTVRAVVTHGEQALLDVSRATRTPPEDARGPTLTPAKAVATIFTDIGSDSRTGEKKLDPGGAYLADYLAKAGFTVNVADPRALDRPAPEWQSSRVILLAGLSQIPPFLPHWLDVHVQAGNGLLVCGPIVFGPFEFTGLLPIKAVVGQVDLVWRPRDGTREFIGASARRYHLSPTTPRHPALAGLPFAPDVPQDIARLHIIEPREDAAILLRYVAGDLAGSSISAPALMTCRHGSGRVALFASPVDWGSPSRWIIYSRLGEHHRELFVRLSLWAAGLLPGQGTD